MNSISLSGRSPGTSWNTLGNSLTIGISLNSGSYDGAMLTAHKYPQHPFFNSLYACIASMIGVLSNLHGENFPIYTNSTTSKNSIGMINEAYGESYTIAYPFLLSHKQGFQQAQG